MAEQTPVAATLENLRSGKKQNHGCDVRFKRRRSTADHRSRGEIQEKVASPARSMVNIVEIASQLGYLHYPG